jgi:hypothetical protein
MSLRSQSSGGLVVLAALLATAAPSFAQNAPAANNSAAVAPITAPTQEQAIDNATGFDKFWSEIGIGHDAKWLFGITYEDKNIEKRARRFEALYLDTLRQYDEDNPTLRTQDLPSPYTTSVMTMEPPAAAPANPPAPGGNTFQEEAPVAPGPVQGMW